jgi:beta-phosphoglucomutase-like phosphatase (HAD superfamily)
MGSGTARTTLVNKIIEEKGVEPYGGSVKLIRQLRHQGFKIAVVTSSQNCTIVLKAAKVDDYFDAQGAHLVVNDLGELVS